MMETSNKGKIAVLGASSGQLAILLKAKEMGYKTIVFGWDEGAVCKEYADKFYPISVTEYDYIAELCRKEQVVAVTTNMADTTALACAKVTEKLGLPGASARIIERVLDKSQVRDLTRNIPLLSKPWSFTINLDDSTTQSAYPQFPCIVKPCTASGKIGVSLCNNQEEFDNALMYARKKSSHILVEQFIEGREISVETISHAGKHYVIQITDKENTGAPHFVELGHHEPALISGELKRKISDVVKNILTIVEYDEAVAHVEMKIEGDDIYLIEINPRGGGGFLSTTIIEQSTGYDYLAAMINLSLGKFEAPEELKTVRYSGMYWLTGNVPERIPAFTRAINRPWVIASSLGENMNKVLESNIGRDSYIIYASDHKITIEDCM